MNKSYFITATDTEVGKTIASVGLLQAAQQYGYVTAGYKPIASGGKFISNRLYNNDALMLQSNSTLMLTYQEVNPYTFAELTSPNIASSKQKKPIDFTVMSAGMRSLEDKKAELIIVEGAGGWFTPLSEWQTFADWVMLEKLPVILVVAIKLGCINHAILTAKAIAYSKLNLVGWIANNTTHPMMWHIEYINTLTKYLFPIPLLGEIPWLGEKVDYSNIGSYLNLKTLKYRLHIYD